MLKKAFHGILIGFCIAGVLSLAYWGGILESWDTKLSDNLFLSRKPDPNIVIIAIDDKSIRAIGRWPWDRAIHAKLLEILANKAAVVGLDVSFPETSSSESDQALEKSLEHVKNIVLPLEAHTIEQGTDSVETHELLTPLPLFSQQASVGLVNMHIDTDGVTRLAPIVIKPSQGTPISSFSYQIAQLYRARKNLPPLGSVPTTDGFVRINFVGPPETFPTYSFLDVLIGGIPAETFSDKIVLIGATAQDLHDTLVTPVSHGKLMSGVEVHANTIQTLLGGRYLSSEAPRETIQIIFFLAITASLVLIFGRVLLSSVTTATLLVGYGVYTFVSFDKGIMRNLVYPPLTLFSVYTAQVIYKYIVESTQKRFLRKAFSYYVSESVLREVLRDPKKLTLGGVRREMTVLFSDIGGFTSLSEQLDPETLAGLLNDYLTRMTKIVFAHKGVLDKYIGDAVMAFWGAPVPEKEHAFLACQTALAMHEEIKKVKKRWAQVQKRNFDVRIGINTGEMVVGNMGSDVRFDYTVLGDSVNLGSRLEGINKEYGTNIIMSDFTYHHVEDKVVARRLDTVAVKGKTKGITIYELRGLYTPSGAEKEFLSAFEGARSLYQGGKFKSALGAFRVLEKKYPEDKPIQVYIARLVDFIKHPPSDWDGVFHAKNK